MKKLSPERLDASAFALFIIMCGSFWLLPVTVPGGVWFMGIGLILLGRDLVQFLVRRLRNEFTTIVGLVFVIGGLLYLVGGPKPVLPIVVILGGMWLLLRNLFARDAKEQVQ